MKPHQIPWNHLKKGGVLLLLVALSLNGCFLKQDRTTTVYGTVVDENKLPLEGVKIDILGTSGLNQGDLLRAVYTNKTGAYETTFDVPKGYRSLSIGLPSVDISQIGKYPSGYLVYIDGIKTQDCCPALIGKKTKYDFTLLFK